MCESSATGVASIQAGGLSGGMTTLNNISVNNLSAIARTGKYKRFIVRRNDDSEIEYIVRNGKLVKL